MPTNPLDAGRQSFAESDFAKLAERVRKRAVGTRLVITASGWVSPLDGGLANEPELTQAALDALRGGLSARWADTLISDIKARQDALVNDRKYFRELNARLTSLLIAQLELDGVEAIHNDEVKAGWYTYTAQISAEDYASQTAWTQALQGVSTVYTTLLKDPYIQEFVDDPQRTALFQAAVSQASFFSPYAKEHESALKYPPGGALPPAFNYMVVDDLTAYPIDPVNGPTAPSIFEMDPTKVYPDSPLAFNNAAFMGTWRSSVMQQMTYSANLKTQSVASDGATTAAQHTLESKKIAADWDNQDVDFRRRRTQLALDTNAFRKSAQSGSDGPHNYVRELNMLRSTFISRLADLCARAQTIVDGLTLYWSAEGVSVPPPPATWDDANGPYLDAFAQWLIGLERVTQSLALTETSSVATFSLSRLVGDTGWKAALAAASPTKPLSVSFVVPAASFGSMHSVRVRGLSASAVGPSDADAGVWSATATLPTQAVVVTEQNVKKQVNQPLPATTLGRIQTRQSGRPPDVVGMALWRNASPCSDETTGSPQAAWTVEVDYLSSNGMAVSKLKDLQLDIVIAARVS